MKRCAKALGSWLLLFPALLFAATTGSIKGTISTADSGEPIVGANVVLDGTTLGAASDINGVYYVTNIPAGSYTLVFTSLGYKTVEVAEVRIHADLLTEMDVPLEATAIEGEIVTIFAERPLIQIDKTSSVQITESAELQELPVRGYNEIIKIQSGVQSYNYNTSNAGRYYNENTNGPRISIRGSREDEVMFNVDGVSLNDPYSGFITFRVPDLAWDEFNFLKGNFSAEYGRYMSGVVNWTTKTGGDEYAAEIEYTSGTEFEQDKYGIALSGPVIPGNDRYRFFGALELGDYGDRGPSYFDEDVKPMNSTEWTSGLFKLTTDVTDNMRLDFGIMYSDEEWNEYRHSYYYNTEHMPYYHDENLGFYGRFNHAVNAELNYTLTASYTDIKRFRGDDMYRDDLGRYQTAMLDDYDETTLFWKEGGMYRGFMKRETESTGLRADVQKLIGFDHDLRMGGEMQMYTLRYYENSRPHLTTFNDANNFGYNDMGDESDGSGVLGDDNYVQGPAEPVTMGMYFQDKIRLDYGIRFDIGVRWDYLDPDARRIKDQDMPFGEDLAFDMDDDTEDTEAFSIFSPRLGVSFPVSDVTTFHFNYGKYTQFPSFYAYFVDYEYFEYVAGSSPYHTVMGSPNLEPTKTTSYEFGIDHGLSEYAALAFTAYYKSMKDYVNAANIPAQPSSYSTYFNMDRAITKGLEFEFRLKPYQNFSAALNYTISWANGTGSSNNGNDRVAWTGSDPPKFTNPLVFDRRHHFSGILKYDFAAGEGPRVANYPILENTTFGFNLDAASGRPYTKKLVYNEVSLGATFPENERSINAVNIDWTYQIDLRVTRSFNFGPVDADFFVNVTNLFDTENYVSVWESSGDPGTTYWLYTNEGQAWLDAQGEEGEAKYLLREDDPNNWSVPRMVHFGVNVRY